MIKKVPYSVRWPFFMTNRDPRYTPSLAVDLSCRTAYAVSMASAIHIREPLTVVKTAPTCTILIGKDNSYVEVSDGFCRLLGYTREELLCMKLDDLAAPGTADLTTAFNLSKGTGSARGLWLLVSREGTRILVRYESRFRIDLLMQTQLELMGAGY
jgi:PAS domain S-box-containing protein